MIALLPTIVDKLSPNNDIDALKLVVDKNSRKRYQAMVKLLNQDLDKQTWFTYLMYDTGFYPVFKLFGIERTNTKAIQGLLRYNWYPTIPNLIDFLNIVMPTGWSYTIENLTGEVKIYVVGNENAVDVVNFSNVTTDIEVYNSTNQESIEVLNSTFTINPQQTYLFYTHIPCGILLTIIYSSGA